MSCKYLIIKQCASTDNFAVVVGFLGFVGKNKCKERENVALLFI